MLTIEVPPEWHVRPGQKLHVFVYDHRTDKTAGQMVQVDKLEITEHVGSYRVRDDGKRSTSYQKQELTCRRRGSPYEQTAPVIDDRTELRYRIPEASDNQITQLVNAIGDFKEEVRKAILKHCMFLVNEGTLSVDETVESIGQLEITTTDEMARLSGEQAFKNEMQGDYNTDKDRIKFLEDMIIAILDGTWSSEDMPVSVEHKRFKEFYEAWKELAHRKELAYRNPKVTDKWFKD